MPAPKNFALIGAAGFVAPRHLKAIRAVNGNLLAAVDPHDSVGVLDHYFPEARFFTEIERFDRFLEKMRRRGDQERVHYLSVCSPNYLHDAHVRLGLRLNADVICEKPLVISPWNLDALADLERETGRRIHTVMQLRLHPELIAAKRALEASPPGRRVDVCLTYVTPRGPWYQTSWKGAPEKSGGLAMNIGVHFFDALLWLFGRLEKSVVHVASATKMSGMLELDRAHVRWLLSIEGTGRAVRSLRYDQREIDFSTGFEDLHSRVYEQIVAGKGFGVADAKPSIDLVHLIRHANAEAPASADLHPFLAR